MSDVVYACSNLVGNVCTSWVKVNQSSLPSLTVEQVWQIFIATAMLFASAWIFRELGYYVKRY